MSDSDVSFEILSDVKPYSVEPLVKKVTKCIYLDPEQPTVPLTPSPGPQQELDWSVFVCVGISLIDESTHDLNQGWCDYRTKVIDYLKIPPLWL